MWDDLDKIPDDEMWKIHCALKTKMIGFVRDKLRDQRIYNGEPVEAVKAVDNMLDPDALTIGFARRFATYKRANLIFRNIERIRKILNKPVMPVQIIFAGKAHPADRPAQEVIKNIFDISKQEGFYGKVILVENYNMTLARNLVQGVDIWLNNPRRPLEASGTSGQKVCINGIINFSVLDGWWCEGYNGKNGWAIGDDTYYDNEYFQDNADSESIYDILEKQIVPLFYERNEKDVPVRWVRTMKESIKSLTYRFSTHRMLQEYTDTMYLPSMERVDKVASDNYRLVSNLVQWKINIEKSWPQVQIVTDKAMKLQKGGRIKSGEEINLSTDVILGGIEPSDVRVELYFGRIAGGNIIDNPETVEMDMVAKQGPGTYRYSVNIRLIEGGEYGYTFRVMPYHADLINKSEMALIRWVVQ